MTPKELGFVGEEIATAYLAQKGYKILTRNWYFDHKELDIIAVDGDEVVIVEVKTRFNNFLEAPHEAVKVGKRRNLVRAADAWMQQHEDDREVRFDVILIAWKSEGNYQLEHFDGAFTPPLN